PPWSPRSRYRGRPGPRRTAWSGRRRISPPPACGRSRQARRVRRGWSPRDWLRSRRCASPPLLPPLRCRHSRLAVIGAVLRAGGAVGAVLVIGGEYPVEGLARVREDLAGLPDLAVRTGAQHLEGGHAHLPDQAAHLDRRISYGAGHRVPRGADLVGVSLDVVAALAGELVAPPAA